MSMERELFRAMRDAQERFPMKAASEDPAKHNQQGIVLQRWAVIIMDELRKEMGRDPELIREFGFEPANLFDMEGETIAAYVHVL